MKRNKGGLGIPMLILLAVALVLVYAMCSGAQAQDKPAAPPQKSEAVKEPAPADAKPPRAWDPAYAVQYDKFVALLDELRKLNATVEYMQGRVNALQQELISKIPPGYTIDDRARQFVPAPPAPVAAPSPSGPPPASTPPLSVTVPPISEKPSTKPVAKIPVKKP